MTSSASNLRVFNLTNYLYGTLSGILLTSLISGHLMASESQDLRLGIHQVSSWHAPNDSQLIIKDHHQNQYQALLKSPCNGLENAKSIAFINDGSNTLNQSSAVILPNGKRCPFKSFSRETTVNEQ